MTNPATLLVEILTEELPPNLVWRLADDFSDSLLAALAEAGFADAKSSPALHDDQSRQKLATPRRLVALLDNIYPTSPNKTVSRRGPPLTVCYDKDGAPLPALLKFMHTVGATCDQELTRIQEKERAYIAWQGEQKGRNLADELPAIVEKVLLGLNAPRLMRWGNNDYKFIRPVRGVMMMHGNTVINGEIMGVASSDKTRGHRVLAPSPVSLSSAAAYPSMMRDKGNVIVDIDQRKENIHHQLWEMAQKKNCKIAIYRKLPAMAQYENHGDEELLNEVTAMCELPTVYGGTMDAEFLSLPHFCVIGCIKKHQRYFPMYQQGKLSPHYLLVADNAPPDPTAMIAGFNAVLRARLRDVEFYLAEDKKLSTDDALTKLKDIVYHKKLGSQSARVARLRKIAAHIAALMNLDNEQKKMLDRAAYLCKADLATHMINEYPEFEGKMAAEYFCADEPEIAAAVGGHNNYKISFSPSPVATALTLTNNLEKLIGMFGIGEKPSGSKDPHGLRSAAAEVAAIIKKQMPSMQTVEIITAARGGFGNIDLPCFDDNEIADFIAERERHRILIEHQANNDNTAKSILNAIFAHAPLLLADIEPKFNALHGFLRLPAAVSLIAANKRINNIFRKSKIDASSLPPPNESLFVEDAEHTLHCTINDLHDRIANFITHKHFRTALEMTATIATPVADFFDQVMVNADDEKIRRNRFALLAKLRTLLNSVADLSKLSG